MHDVGVERGEGVVGRGARLPQDVVDEQRETVVPLARDVRWNTRPLDVAARDGRGKVGRVGDKVGERAASRAVADERGGRLEDRVHAPPHGAVEEHAEKEALEDGGRAGDERRAGHEDDRGDVVVQAKLEARQRREDADDDTADDVPAKVEEEPASAADYTELVDDDEKEENDEDDDGDETARFLLDVVRRESVDGDPAQGDLRAERVWSASGTTTSDRADRTLMSSPTQKPAKYHTVRSRIKPEFSNAGATQRQAYRQKASPTKRTGRKF